MATVEEVEQELSSFFGKYVYYINDHDEGRVLKNNNEVFEYQGGIKAQFWHVYDRPIVVPLDSWIVQGDQWKLTNGTYIRKTRPGQVIEN